MYAKRSTSADAVKVTTNIGGEGTRAYDSNSNVYGVLRICSAVFAVCVALGFGVANVADSYGFLAPVAAIVGVIGVTAVLLSAEFALGCLLAAVILFQSSELFQWSLPLFGGGLKIPDIVLLMAAIGFLIRELIPGSPTFRPVERPSYQVSLLLVGGFAVWACMSAWNGIQRGNDYKDSLVELRPLLQYVWMIPLSREVGFSGIKRLLAVVFGGAIAISIQALYLFATGAGEFGTYTGGYIRIMSVEFGYILFCFLLAFTFYLGWDKYRILSLTTMGLTFSALVITFQRSAFFGLAVGIVCIVCLFGRRGWRRIAARVLSLVGVGMLMISSLLFLKPQVFGPLIALTDRMASVGDFASDDSAQHRLREWSACLVLIGQRPVVGNGLGTRIEFFSPMYEREHGTKGYWSNDIYTHNSYVWTTTKMGGIGLLLLLLTIGNLLWKGLGYVQKSLSSGEQTVVIGLLSCMVALCVISIFGPMLNTPNITPFVGFCGGAILMIGRPDRAMEELSK